MLLSEKFGKLSDLQTNKLRTVNSNVQQIEEVINNLLNEKQFNVIDSTNDNQSGTSHVIKELEQKNLILGKMVQNEEKRYTLHSRKHVFIIAGLIAMIGISIPTYSLFMAELVGQEYRITNIGSTNDV